MASAAKKRPTPRKEPSQDRSRATVDTIIDAAARILVKDGYDAFTTNRVAEKAGVSIGSLYQYFPNKEALLSELMRRHTEELEKGVEEMVERAKSAPLADVVRAAIDHNVRLHLVNPALHRKLSDEVPSLGPLDWEAAFAERTIKRVRQVLEACRDEIVVEDLDLAVYILTHTVEALIHNSVTERPDDLKSGKLTDEVTRMLLSYLTGKTPRRMIKAAAE